MRDRLLVNSIPKSGTYLLSLYLSELGGRNSGLHFRQGHYWNFEGAEVPDMVRNPHGFRIDAPLEDSLGLISEGRFAVSHLDNTEAVREAMARYRVQTIFLRRDLRSCLVSSMRFVSNPLRDHKKYPWEDIKDPKGRFLEYLKLQGKEFLKAAAGQVSWVDEPDMPTIRFEDFAGSAGALEQRRAIEIVLDWCRLPVPLDTAMAILSERCLGRSTRTFSGRLSEPEHFWSDAVQELFESFGGANMNQALGFH